MRVAKQEGTLQDVVIAANWLASDSVDGIEAQQGGLTELQPAEPGSFTPYDQLTEAQVLAWVQAVLGAEQVAAIEASLAAQIEYAKNPPVVTPPLPWG